MLGVSETPKAVLNRMQHCLKLIFSSELHYQQYLCDNYIHYTRNCIRLSYTTTPRSAGFYNLILEFRQ